MIKLKPFNLIQIMSQILGSILFLVGLILSNTLYMDVGILLFWIGNIFYGINNINKRVFFLAFQVTFFTFLMGRTVANIISNSEDIHQFSNEILVHTKLCIFIAVVSLFLIYWLVENFRFTFSNRKLKQNREINRTNYNSSVYTSIREVSKWLFFATYIFDVLVTLEKAGFVQANGYAEYYVSYSSSFPYVLVKLGDVSQVFLFMFLATMPSKKESRIPLLLYIIVSVLGMFTGKRSELVVPLMFIILYCCIRNNTDDGEGKWLTWRHVLFIAVLTPFLLAGLYLFNIYRFGGSSSDTSLLSMIAGFFDNLGFSSNVISYEKYYEMQIPDKFYSIGDTIDYLRENVLTQLIFDFPVYKSQTVAKALYGNNFSQTITYLYSSSFYLSGRGLGSSYIAEAYHDFGYFGIILWSGIYAVVLRYLYSFKNVGIVRTTLAFCVLKYILLAPRNMASAFVTELINLDTWVAIIAVLLIAKFLRDSYFVRGAVQKE